MTIFGTNPDLLSNLFEPGLVLFAISLFAFGAAVALLLVLKKNPNSAYYLMAILIVIELCLLGASVYNLFVRDIIVVNGTLPYISELFLAHRWTLLQIPKIAIFTSIVVLAVYGPNIVKKHAKYYLGFVSFSVLLSFVTLITVVFESAL